MIPAELPCFVMALTSGMFLRCPHTVYTDWAEIRSLIGLFPNETIANLKLGSDAALKSRCVSTKRLSAPHASSSSSRQATGKSWTSGPMCNHLISSGIDR
jgi:hypothetical protein